MRLLLQQPRRVQQVVRHGVVEARVGDVVVQGNGDLEGALRLAEEEGGVVAVRVTDRVQPALARAARPAVVRDDEVGQRAAQVGHGVQDGRHGGRGVGVPEGRPALQHRDIGELEHHALVRHQP